MMRTLVAMLLLAGCTTSVDAPAAPPVTTSQATESVTADDYHWHAALSALPVKGRAPKTGYDRGLFPHWRDVDNDGCRADDQAMLATMTVTEIAGRCDVVAGMLLDPYTGTMVEWRKGDGTVHIDHIVSLSDAWQKGAQKWDAATRLAFANDPANLLAVSARANRAKSDSDAATWQPKNKAFRCELAKRQITVKAKYDLWVTQAEATALSAQLQSC